MSNHQLQVNFSKNLDKWNRVYISDDCINAFWKHRPYLGHHKIYSSGYISYILSLFLSSFSSNFDPFLYYIYKIIDEYMQKCVLITLHISESIEIEKFDTLSKFLNDK